MNQQEQQAFLISTFREEIDGHTVNLTRELVELEEVGTGPAQGERLREIMRLLHTVKGAARMMGFPSISRVAHVMEELVGNYRDRQPPLEVPRPTIDMLFEGLDIISEMTREVTRQNPGGDVNPMTTPEVLEVLLGKMAVIAGKPELVFDKSETQKNNSSNGHSNGNGNGNGNGPYHSASPNNRSDEQIIYRTVDAPPSVIAPASSEAGESRGERAGEETIRVRLNKLDDLINLAGELVINKQQNEEHLQALQDLLRQSRTRSRVAQQLREYLIERVPVEERSRLLGITELFSFEQPQMPEWVQQDNLAKTTAAAANKGSSFGANLFGDYERNGNGHGNGNGRDKFKEDPLGLKKIFGKIEEMIAFDSQLEQSLGAVLRERKAYNLRFGAAADELRRNMLGIRMLPLDTIFGRFARPLRDLAYERGKEVRLVVVGGAIEVDKRILEQISDPLIHLLRNAVDHGIEEPGIRLAAGKPAEGTLRLSALQKGSHVLIQVIDDGSGIDPQHLRQVAVQKGYMDSATAMGLSDETALDLIYRPGFSTRDRADELSGRGIGMDIVQKNIKRLNGRILVQSVLGQGTTFSMEIPLTLATVDALIIQCAGQLFALPSVMVAGTLRAARDTLQSVEGRPVMRLRGQLVPVIRLEEILSISRPPDLEDDMPAPQVDDNYFSGVLLSAGAGSGATQDVSERFICFEIESLIDEREVVVKGLGSFLDKTPNIAGVTVLGADGLALILDVFGLVQSARMGSSGTVVFEPSYNVAAAADAAPLAPRRARRILVVDDSLATRELERSILETAGFKVDTARDGLEALKMCRERKPDLVLSDVEMPNMDGFRLSAAIRQDERLNNLPIIIVSSRDSEEDRRKGMDAGAQAYIVKGQFEQNKLLETISRLIA